MSGGFPYLEENQRIQFPAPDSASPEGILGAGGNLSPGMLLSAYTQGIFPWYSPGEPILWWSPDPRFILFPRKIHISKSLRKILRKNIFSYTFDKCFRRVMKKCGEVPRPGQNGTWITGEMLDGYCRLNGLGYAHSVEVWQDGTLAGGLYGVSLGDIFFGESMFAEINNASKSGFAVLNSILQSEGFLLIDSQVYTPHLERFGAEEIPRPDYLNLLKRALKGKTRKGDWGDLFNNRVRELEF
ncbi:MAG: leucyl/phenylalanyl-tRNA--protein transferase [Spirochaetia bacterium]